MLYNVIFSSAVQKSESVIHVYISPLFWISSPFMSPDRSVGKESACNAGDPSLIPGLGRSTGEGKGYLLQVSWASLWLRGQRICLQCRGPGFYSWVGKIPWRSERLPSILAWRIPCTIYSPWGLKESDATERLSLTSLRSPQSSE